MISVTSAKLVKDIKEEFKKNFPFLNIDFFKMEGTKCACRQKLDKLPQHLPIGELIFNKEENGFAILPSMTVVQLENICKEQLGLYVKLSRVVGNSSIKISMTNTWTLQEQNERGSEISFLINKEV